MPIDLPSSSRYKFTTPVVSAAGQETFGLMAKPRFLVAGEYENYRVSSTMAHRPDLIASDYYGTPDLYWVVIMYNRPANPFRFPEANSIIKLPISSDVMFAM